MPLSPIDYSMDSCIDAYLKKRRVDVLNLSNHVEDELQCMLSKIQPMKEDAEDAEDAAPQLSNVSDESEDTSQSSLKFHETALIEAPVEASIEVSVEDEKANNDAPPSASPSKQQQLPQQLPQQPKAKAKANQKRTVLSLTTTKRSKERPLSPSSGPYSKFVMTQVQPQPQSATLNPSVEVSCAASEEDPLAALLIEPFESEDGDDDATPVRRHVAHIHTRDASDASDASDAPYDECVDQYSPRKADTPPSNFAESSPLPPDSSQAAANVLRQADAALLALKQPMATMAMVKARDAPTVDRTEVPTTSIQRTEELATPQNVEAPIEKEFPNTPVEVPGREEIPSTEAVPADVPALQGSPVDVSTATKERALFVDTANKEVDDDDENLLAIKNNVALYFNKEREPSRNEEKSPRQLTSVFLTFDAEPAKLLDIKQYLAEEDLLGIEQSQQTKLAHPVTNWHAINVDTMLDEEDEEDDLMEKTSNCAVGHTEEEFFESNCAPFSEAMEPAKEGVARVKLLMKDVADLFQMVDSQKNDGAIQDAILPATEEVRLLLTEGRGGIESAIQPASQEAKMIMSEVVQYLFPSNNKKQVSSQPSTAHAFQMEAMQLLFPASKNKPQTLPTSVEAPMATV